ncbi:MAG: hypothetical protein A2018_03220 [Alphaproteobacteria bacterium GWF2_58_20]|nr:MAG: hypothetical protein A2018_03220 [Alphaproteobacteria bacterium GWF2_58_20]
MALLDEEDDGRKVKKQPKPLDNLGIVELEEYIGALRAEIVRTEAVIAAKKAHRAGIEGLFKTVSGQEPS